MSSKLQLAGVMVLAAFLAGCGSTKTGSIVPDHRPEPVDPTDPTDPTDPATQQHSMLSRFLSYAKDNTGAPEHYTGTMEVKIEDGVAEMKLPISAMGTSISQTNMANIGGQRYGKPDDFLDLGQSGDNYTMGAVFTQDTYHRYVGVGVAGDVYTTQHTADAEYKGKMQGAAVPQGWGPEPGEAYVSPYRLTGDVELSLEVFPSSNAQISGEIKNVKIDDVMDVPGQINLLSSPVSNGVYEGSVTHNLAGHNGSGAYNGAFYGDEGEETAGTLSFSGQIPGGVIPGVGATTGYEAVGGFGAKKQP